MAFFFIAMVGEHAGIVPLKSVAKSMWRKGGKYLDTNWRIGIYDGTGLRWCEHSRERSKCKEYGRSGTCENGRQRSHCKECGGVSICEHGRQRSRYKECGGSQICEHGRQKSRCKECCGSQICEHGRQRSRCKNCKVSKCPTGVQIVACPNPMFFAGAFKDSSRDDMSDS